MFGAARWASLDDLLLHAALGLEGARVLRLLHEEEWEAELAVQHTLITAASVLLCGRVESVLPVLTSRIKEYSGASSLLTLQTCMHEKFGVFYSLRVLAAVGSG